MAVCTECGAVLDPAWKYCIHCGTPVPGPAVASPPAPVNPVAVLALVLGALASPLALVFGPIALVQLRSGRERGRLPAIVATALGAGWTVIAVAVAVALLGRG